MKADAKLTGVQIQYNLLIKTFRSLHLSAFSEIVRRQVVLKNLMTVLSEHKMSFYAPTIGTTTRYCFHSIVMDYILLIILH